MGLLGRERLTEFEVALWQGPHRGRALELARDARSNLRRLPSEERSRISISEMLPSPDGAAPTYGRRKPPPKAARKPYEPEFNLPDLGLPCDCGGTQAIAWSQHPQDSSNIYKCLECGGISSNSHFRDPQRDGESCRGKAYKDAGYEYRQ